MITIGYFPVYLLWVYEGAILYPLLICLFLAEWDTDFCSWDDEGVAFKIMEAKPKKYDQIEQ